LACQKLEVGPEDQSIFDYSVYYKDNINRIQICSQSIKLFPLTIETAIKDRMHKYHFQKKLEENRSKKYFFVHRSQKASKIPRSKIPSKNKYIQQHFFLGINLYITVHIYKDSLS